MSTPSSRSSLGVMLLAVALALSWLGVVTTTWRHAADLGHAWLVPFLAAYLWWERWEERPPFLRASIRRGWAGPVLGCVALLAIPLRLLLTPYPLWPAVVILYTALCAGLALAGAGLLAGRPGVRWVGGPLILLLTCVPIPSRWETSIVLPLREGIASLTAELCNGLGHPALASGTSIRLATGWVGVEDACSGIRSLQACAMLGLFFGEWFRFGLGRRALLLIIGLAMAVLGNFSRVLFLSLSAAHDRASVDSVHDLAGWAAMLASLVATGWIAFAWARYRMPATLRLERSPNPSPAVWRALVLPATLLVAADLGTRIWYARGEAVTAGVARWTAVFPSGHWSYQARPLAAQARAILQPDGFVAGGWKSGEQQVEAYYVEWRTGQLARSVPFHHNPTVCLPYAGCELVATLDPIDVPGPGGEVRFYVHQFRRAGDEMLVAFTIWDSARGKLLHQPRASDWLSWWLNQWRDVRDARQHQPAQLLAVSLSGPEQEKSAALQETLRTLIVPISTP